ncbi:hypothetical protein [Bacillus horti]|uniref:Copper amine oxidase-like N-terminal domain-containing protein n=1 Tax=Caldalkalibacillus horti TaxID=77523 RepID=A0ABT9VUC9_9BACI|nr:hypothetical protein [Bacillus horti]MDQ0164235.1 hypothetical protein [Bacillus horti]
MNNKLGKRYMVLSFFLGVIITFIACYLLLPSHNQSVPTSTPPEPPEEEMEVVYISPNEIVVQRTSRSVMIDGMERDLSEEGGLLSYQGQVYAPLETLSEYLGKSYTEAANGIVIGNYSAIEPLTFSDSVIPFSYIGSSINREQMEERLGPPINEQLVDHVPGGGSETVVEYEGVTVHYSANAQEPKVLRIIVHEPILMTHRGITVGSTKEEVLSKYGEPEPESEENQWLYGETYTLWFHFEEDEVIEFSNLYVPPANEEDESSNDNENDSSDEEEDDSDD